MNVQEALAFAAIRGSRSPEEIKAFSAQLLADHDAIVRYDWLKDNLDKTPKDERKKIYARLNDEIAKYPGMARHEDPCYGKPLLALRAKMGLFRGVKWDRFGKLRLTSEVRQDNVRALKAKLDEMLGPNADLSQTFGPKAEAIKQSIAEHQAFLDGTKKTTGSIWDFITSDAGSAAELDQEKEG